MDMELEADLPAYLTSHTASQLLCTLYSEDVHICILDRAFGRGKDCTSEPWLQGIPSSAFLNGPVKEFLNRPVQRCRGGILVMHVWRTLAYAGLAFGISVEISG